MPEGTHDSQRDSTRTVFNSARALLLIQIANQVLPLILVPYLARVLGTDLYGVVSFAAALATIGLVVTDYGFNLSATLKISKHREDREYVNKLIGAVFLSKAVLVSVVLTVFITYALNTEKYSSHAVFLILLTLPLLFQTYQPVWFFQGIEKMSQMAAFTLLSRILYVVLVFALVKTSSDYVWTAFSNLCSQLFALALALWLMWREGYKPRWPGIGYAWEEARHSTQFFWSRAAVSTYTAGCAIYLGLFSTPREVAFYSSADQLYRGGQSVFAPLSQALYPNMVRTHNFKLLFRVIKWATLVCVAGGIFSALFGDFIIELIFGAEFHQTYLVLLVLLAALTVNTPSVLLGYPLLGALDQAGKANLSVMLGGALQLVLLSIFYAFDWKSAIYIATSVFVVETLVLLARAHWGRYYYTNWLNVRNNASINGADLVPTGLQKGSL
jgi:PST family polysaccharide transporter